MPLSKRTRPLHLTLIAATVTALVLIACGSTPYLTQVSPNVTSLPAVVPTSIIVDPGDLLPLTGGGDAPSGDAPPSVEDELVQIDEALNNSVMKGSIVYNPPKEMSLNKPVVLELLLNPSLSEPELVQQIQESDYTFSDQVEITPRMKAEIISADRDAFVIERIHDQPVQIISGTDTTKWSWYITAKKGGTQNLTIVLYRYVKYEGEEYWREVETYRSDIAVKVSLLNRLQSLGWYWIAGILGLAVVIPTFWRWLDQRKKRGRGSTSLHAMPTFGSTAVSTGHAFISYRRSDSADIVGRIYDRLVDSFGDEPIFKDVEDIPLGVDFKEFLNQRVGECTLLLAVIGDRWVNTSDAAGKQRLDDPNDFVRIEIEAALARDIPVIPLLVRGASMPTAADLPPSLQKLVYKNGIPIRSDPDFHNDIDRLITALEKYLR